MEPYTCSSSVELRWPTVAFGSFQRYFETWCQCWASHHGPDIGLHSDNLLERIICVFNDFSTSHMLMLNSRAAMGQIFRHTRPRNVFFVRLFEVKWARMRKLGEKEISFSPNLLIMSKHARSIDYLMCHNRFGSQRTTTGSFDCAGLCLYPVMTECCELHCTHIQVLEKTPIPAEHLPNRIYCRTLGFVFQFAVIWYMIMYVYFSDGHACPYFGFTSALFYLLV